MLYLEEFVQYVGEMAHPTPPESLNHSNRVNTINNLLKQKRNELIQETSKKSIDNCIIEEKKEKGRREQKQSSKTPGRITPNWIQYCQLNLLKKKKKKGTKNKILKHQAG